MGQVHKKRRENKGAMTQEGHVKGRARNGGCAKRRGKGEANAHEVS